MTTKTKTGFKKKCTKIVFDFHTNQQLLLLLFNFTDKAYLKIN